MKFIKHSCVILVLIFFATITKVYAHPHVFISPKVQIFFNEHTLSKVNIEWIFDDMTSFAILDLYDKNKNKKIDPTEQKTIMSKTFNNFGEFNYFTFLEIDGKIVIYGKPCDFHAKVIKNDILHYSFTIPVNKKVNKKMKLWFKDETNYVGFDFMKENVAVKQIKGEKPAFSMKLENYLEKLNVIFK